MPREPKAVASAPVVWKARPEQYEALPKIPEQVEQMIYLKFYLKMKGVETWCEGKKLQTPAR